MRVCVYVYVCVCVCACVCNHHTSPIRLFTAPLLFPHSGDADLLRRLIRGSLAKDDGGCGLLEACKGLSFLTAVQTVCHVLALRFRRVISKCKAV